MIDEKDELTIKAFPWEGENYARGCLGCKIMILGESSYGPQPLGYDHRKECIALANDAIGYDNGEWNKSRFYTRIARIFGFDPHKREDRKRFWQSVSYYNYLIGQQPGPRTCPAESLWLEANEPFLEIVNDMKPDVVFAFSQRMWNYIGKNGNAVNLNIPCAIFMRSNCLNREDGGKTLLIGFKHPCGRAFVWQSYSKPVQEIISGNILNTYKLNTD